MRGGLIAPYQVNDRRSRWKRVPDRRDATGDASPFARSPSARHRLATRLFDSSLGVLVGLGLIAIGGFAFQLVVGGADARFGAVALLSLGVAFAVWFVARRARDPLPLESGALVDRLASGELKRLATTFDRASSGLAFSRALFLDRMARAFLEKIRIGRAMSPEDIDEILVDSRALESLVGDRELAGFIRENRILGPMDTDAEGRTTSRSAFVQDIERILAKMEAWQ